MNGARCSTFKEPPVRGSWTVRKMTQRLTSNWLLECCGFCYAGRKTVSTSRPSSTNWGRKKILLEPAVELRTSAISLTKLRDNGELASDETSATKHDCGVSKKNKNVVKNEERSTNRKDDSSIDSKNEFSSDSGTWNSGTMLMTSLPTFSKKDRAWIDDGRKASESDTDMACPANIFLKCSKRYKRQEAPRERNNSRLRMS